MKKIQYNFGRKIDFSSCPVAILETFPVLFWSVISEAIVGKTMYQVEEHSYHASALKFEEN